MRDLPVGAIVQLERKDFFRVDSVAADGELTLILVPDGKPRSWGVSSKAALAAAAEATAAKKAAEKASAQPKKGK